MKTLEERLGKESPTALRENATYSPHWIARKLYELADKLETHD